MSAVAEAFSVSRQHLSASTTGRLHVGEVDRPTDTDLSAMIRALIADLPTYGYRRSTPSAPPGCQDRRTAPNPKRALPGHEGVPLLLQRHNGSRGVAP